MGRGTGSRYPSAFGHTPTYRSYSSIPDASISDMSRDLTRDLGISHAGVSAFGRNPTTSLLDTDFSLSPSTRAGTTSSSKKVSSYSSSSYSSTSKDGGRPMTEYSTDSTYRSTATGPYVGKLFCPRMHWTFWYTPYLLFSHLFWIQF